MSERERVEGQDREEGRVTRFLLPYLDRSVEALDQYATKLIGRYWSATDKAAKEGNWLKAIPTYLLMVAHITPVAALYGFTEGVRRGLTYSPRNHLRQ